MQGRSRGLRFRLIVAFLAFAAGVALLFAAAGHAALPVIEDHVSEHLLALETERVRRHVEERGALPPPSPFSAYYLGVAALPPSLGPRVAHLPPGRHELRSSGRELWVSRSAPPVGSEPLFVVYDVSDSPSSAWRHVIALGALGILAGGTALGLWVARRTARPLTELAATVGGTSPAQLADRLAERAYDQELQALVDRLVTSLRALDANVAREQRFARYASHELRSPVAVIRGAVELLKLTPQAREPAVGRPLERIERAAADMLATIDCFLWLAREREDTPAPPAVELLPAVERVIERYRYLLAGKPIAVTVESGPAFAVAAPPGVIEIVLGNLIANAFHYTERGDVAVTLAARTVVVEDTGPGMPHELADGRPFARGEKSVGYGLGLSIVRSLCDRFGWRLEVESTVGVGTRSTLRLGLGRRATRRPRGEPFGHTALGGVSVRKVRQSGVRQSNHLLAPCPAAGRASPGEARGRGRVTFPRHRETPRVTECRFMTSFAAVAVGGQVRVGDWFAVHAAGGAEGIAVIDRF